MNREYERHLIDKMNLKLMNSRNLRNGLWVSYHEPSSPQVCVLKDKYGVKIVGLEEGLSLGVCEVTSKLKKEKWIEELERLRSVYSPMVIAGSFPEPLWYYMTHIQEIIILSPVEKVTVVDGKKIIDHMYFVRINSK